MPRGVRVFVSLLTLCCGAVRADSYSQRWESRIVDDSGRYYVVVQRKGGPIFTSSIGGPWTLTIAAREPGSAPVSPATTWLRREGDSYVRVANADVAVRAGDRVLGHCELRVPPFIVDISSTGLGVATLDVWPFNRGEIRRGERNALILISMSGEIRFRKSLAELFGVEAEQFGGTMDRIHWYSSYWIDEARREMIIVARNTIVENRRPTRLLRAVSFDTGKVRVGEPADVARGISDALAGKVYYKLDTLLDLACSMKLREAEACSKAISTDEKLPVLSRLRSLVVLNELGDKRGGKLFEEAALKTGKGEERTYAIDHFDAFLGDAALPVLQRIVQEDGGRIDPTVEGAFQRVGSKAVPTLLRMLDDESNLPGRFDAIRTLGRLGGAASTAVPSLIRALRNRTQMTEGTLTSRIDGAASWASAK